MKRTILLALAVVTTLALAACGSSGGSSSDPSTTAAALPGTSWQLVSYPLTGSGKATQVPDNVKVTAAFTADQVSGNGGCNQYGGAYKTTGGEISIGPVRSTMMACEALAIETAFTTTLDAATTYAISGDTLTLTTKDGRALVFSRAQK